MRKAVFAVTSALASRPAILVALWGCAALAFAVSRVPYDDEWFSITLATATDLPHFWASLQNDVHPPWLATLHRGLYGLAESRAAFNALSVAAVCAGLLLLRGSLCRVLAIGPVAFAAAACHPVFFYYAGAARWYPLVFLAGCLRVSALFSRHPGSAGSLARFLAGSLLGPAAGYADLAFVCLDTGALILATRGIISGRRLAVLLTSTAAAVLLPLLLSPLGRGAPQAPMDLVPGLGVRSLVSAATWLGPGLAGEAHPPLPWVALAALPAAVLLAAVGRTLVASKNRLFTVWCAATILMWFALSLTGSIWHPRYSLLLWWLATASAIKLMAGRRGLRRSLVLGGFAYLALSLCLAITGRGFLKADLNILDEAVCRSVSDGGAVDLILAPYPRTAELLSHTCRLQAEVLTLPVIRHYPEAGEQLAPLQAPLAGVRTLLLIEDQVSESSLAITNSRARSAISAICSSIHVDSAGDLPFLAIRKRFLRSTRTKRLVVELFSCDAAHE